MSTYRMDDGIIVKTENASQSWREATRWDGKNNISVATDSQWNHQILYRSRKGRYYIKHSSQCSGSLAYAEWLPPEEAARWLLANGHELPEDLAPLETEVCE
jgi:hypothetical protein